MRGYEFKFKPAGDLPHYKLRIPMRGYEAILFSRPSADALCYESPCGVMSRGGLARFVNGRSLRIPMRGYELRPVCAMAIASNVTNPHAGL